MTRTKRLIMVVILAIMITLSTSKEVQAEGETSPILKADGTNLKYRNTNTNVMGLTNYEYKTSDFRAVWVATVSNLDIDKLSSSDQAGIDAYKAELTAIINNMKSWGMNAMIFQIRPMNDAFYDSTLNHWSNYLYNGANPGWDMLGWLIDECHKNGIEFQAWLNPYRVTGSGVTALADYSKTIADKNALYGKNNLAADPSSLLLTSSNGVIYNPGDPRVRQFLINTIKEIVEKYDVDGIHFDDYFYASLKDDTSDNLTMQQYPVAGITTKADWRREQVTTFIRDLSTFLKNFNLANNRAVQLGISPTGIWANKSSNSLGSNTSGFEHYGPYLYCDTRKWVKENIIDYILPQTYWGLEHTTAPFADLAQWWATTVRGTQVNLYLGDGLYMEAEGRADWVGKPNEIDNQLKVMGVYPEIKGYSFYRYGFVRDTKPSLISGYNGVNLIKNDYWKKAVPGPALQRYPNMVAAAPKNLQLAGNTLTWQVVDGARGYNVYKVSKGSVLDVKNPNNLFTYTASNSVSVDISGADYYVASVSKANNLSTAVKLTNSLGDANSVINAINALPDQVTYNDQFTVSNIRTGYNALSSSDKALVTNYSRLVTAEAQLVKILEEQAEQFEAAKVSAKATLAGYVNPDDYSEENRHAIEEILASADDRIDVAATITQINTIVADTKTALDGVVTSLVEKSNAKIELDDYPVYENYSEDRKTQIQDLIASGKAAIDQATTSAGVSSAVAACKTAIDQVPILEEEEQLELAEYISSKVVELKNYADMSRYTIENQEKVQEIMDRYEPLIKNAESIYQAGALFRDAKAEINTIEKLPAPAGCSFVPAASTFFAMFAALAALGYLWLRRR